MSKIIIILLLSFIRENMGDSTCLLSYQPLYLSSSINVINLHLKIGYSLSLMFRSFKMSKATATFSVYYWHTVYTTSYVSVEVFRRIAHALVEILSSYYLL